MSFEEYYALNHYDNRSLMFGEFINIIILPNIIINNFISKL